MAARAEPMAKVMEMVALTLMPMSWAAALSSEQARMALPILVRPVNHTRAAMMTTQASTVTMEAMVIFSSPPKRAMGWLEKKALAAIAGVLFCSAYPILTPTTGAMPGIKAFTAAVFGGIGSIPGALLGGVLLGMIEIFASAYISTQLSNAIVFAVLIVVLLVRPTGLLGKQVREKV